MRVIHKLRTHADVLALGLLFLSIPMIAVIAPKLIFWCPILAVFLVLPKNEWSNVSSFRLYAGSSEL